MRYLSLAACLSATLAIAGPVSANPDCTVFGEIAQRAAVERRDGKEMMTTMVTIAESFTGEEQRFAAAVSTIVDWVWQLPESDLDGDVATAWREPCESMSSE